MSKSNDSEISEGEEWPLFIQDNTDSGNINEILLKPGIKEERVGRGVISSISKNVENFFFIDFTDPGGGAEP